MIVLNNTDKNRFNCIKWVRDRVQNLPYGLWTIWDKKKIIDTQTAKIGRVAIMNVGLPWGHVGIVTNVYDDLITIIEANYRAGKITQRYGTKEKLKILGFFNPQKKRWQ